MTRSPALGPVGASDPTGTRLRYESVRRTGARPRSVLEVEIGAEVAEPSALDLFLTARFGLHSSVLGQSVWIPNTHAPWPLREARVVELDDQLVAAAGFPGIAATAPDAVRFSTGVETVFGLPQRLR